MDDTALAANSFLYMHVSAQQLNANTTDNNLKLAYNATITAKQGRKFNAFLLNETDYTCYVQQTKSFSLINETHASASCKDSLDCCTFVANPNRTFLNIGKFPPDDVGDVARLALEFTDERANMFGAESK